MAKKKENTTSIGFEDAIWRAADKLSGFFAESHRLEEEIKKQLGSIGFTI